MLKSLFEIHKDAGNKPVKAVKVLSNPDDHSRKTTLLPVGTEVTVMEGSVDELAIVYVLDEEEIRKTFVSKEKIWRRVI